MKFRLDENLGSRTAAIIAESGHDVETVAEEKLSGTADERLLEICIAERRCLITLDLDFSEVLRFPPRNASGIAVLRLPRRVSPGSVDKSGTEAAGVASDRFDRRKALGRRSRPHSGLRGELSSGQR